MFSNRLVVKAQNLLKHCRATKPSVVTAESCTGGLIAGCPTAAASPGVPTPARPKAPSPASPSSSVVGAPGV